jgi:glutamate dehydrogenase
VTNSLVDRAGTTFVFRLTEETGATGPGIARAFAVAREVFDLERLWEEVEALDGRVPAKTQLAMLLKSRILLERATRWLLRNRPRPLDIAATAEHYRSGAGELAASAGDLLGTADREAARRTAEEFVAAGVPTQLARRVAQLESLVPALDLVDVTTATGVGFQEVARVYFAIDDRLDLHALRGCIAALPRDERWDALARRALWEDLQSEHRSLTLDVLQESGDGSVAERVRAWLAHNAAAVERTGHVLADVRAGDATDLATLSVAVREIRNLIEATSSPTVTDDDRAGEMSRAGATT